MRHSRPQQLTFYIHLQRTLQDDHLQLYIRELLTGQDIQTKRYLKTVVPFGGLKQEGYELLWCYVQLLEINVPYINNALNNITMTLDREGWYALKGKLQDTLDLLGLPRLE